MNGGSPNDGNIDPLADAQAVFIVGLYYDLVMNGMSEIINAVIR